MLQKCFRLIFCCLLTLEIFIQPLAESKPVAGRKGAFGAGVLGGALAGVVLTKALSNNNHNNNAPHNVNPTPLPTNTNNGNHVTVERGETLSNGCYRQIVRQPDPIDNRKFYETDQWICPSVTPALAPVASSPVMSTGPAPISSEPIYPYLQEHQAVPVMAPAPVQPSSLPVEPAPHSPPAVAPAPSQPSFVQPSQLVPADPQPPAVAPAPVQPLFGIQPAPYAPPAVAPAPVQPSLPLQPATHLPLPMPIFPNTVAVHQQPAVIDTTNSQPSVPQVYVVSRKTGYYGNSANSLGRFRTNFYVMFIAAVIAVILC